MRAIYKLLRSTYTKIVCYIQANITFSFDFYVCIEEKCAEVMLRVERMYDTIVSVKC